MIIGALLLIIAGAAIVIEPYYGLEITVTCVGIFLIFSGIRLMVYFYTMARHMVGGVIILYKGLIELDFGAFIFSLSELPKYYAAIFIIAIFVIEGVKDVLEAIESKKLQSHWRFRASAGAVKMAIALFCLFHVNSLRTISYMICLCLFNSALVMIVTALRRTAIIYTN